MSGTRIPVELESRRRAILAERADIAVKRAELIARDEQLIREEVALRYEAEARTDEPYSVGPQWIIRNNDVSERAFWRAVKSADANGFPRPFRGFTSDPRWVWADVKKWLLDRSDEIQERKTRSS
jgi:hypothetical protein